MGRRVPPRDDLHSGHLRATTYLAVTGYVRKCRSAGVCGLDYKLRVLTARQPSRACTALQVLSCSWPPGLSEGFGAAGRMLEQVPLDGQTPFPRPRQVSDELPGMDGMGTEIRRVRFLLP